MVKLLWAYNILSIGFNKNIFQMWKNKVFDELLWNKRDRWERERNEINLDIFYQPFEVALEKNLVDINLSDAPMILIN